MQLYILQIESLATIRARKLFTRLGGILDESIHDLIITNNNELYVRCYNHALDRTINKLTKGQQ